MTIRIDDAHSDTEKAVGLLRERGYFYDDECFGSALVENNGPEIDRVARLRGYDGGQIRNLGAFVSGHGAIYMAYDSGNIAPERAKDILDHHAARR